MKPLRLAILTASVSAISAGLASAHHGWGSYDAATPVTVTAKIEQVALENPHGMMVLTAGGKTWHVTLAPLRRMNARGATADVIKAGAEITAHGYPKRDGTPEFRAEWIEIGGTRYQLR